MSKTEDDLMISALSIVSISEKSGKKRREDGKREEGEEDNGQLLPPDEVIIHQS